MTLDRIDQIFQSLVPLKSEAQILLELDKASDLENRIREVVKGIKLEWTEYLSDVEKDPVILKIVLPKEVMQNVIMHLTDAGCSKIMALDSEN